MATREEIIDVITRFSTRGNAKYQQIVKQSTEAVSGGQRITTNFYEKTKKGSERLLRSQTKLKKETFKFHGEWLSLMFLGAGIYRMFGGIVQAQMELFGINELFSATLTTVMLPVMEILSDLLMPIAEWMMSWSDSTKLVVGWGIVLAAVIGGLLLVIFSAALGIQGLIAVLGTLGLINAVPRVGVSGVDSAMSGVGKLSGALKIIAGLGLITVGIVGAISFMSEKGEITGGQLIKLLGSAVAVGLGGVLLGASIAGGIVIGGVVVAVGLSWRFAKESSEKMKEYQDKMATGNYLDIGQTSSLDPSKLIRMPSLSNNRIVPYSNSSDTTNNNNNASISNTFNINGTSNSDIVRQLQNLTDSLYSQGVKG